YDETIESERIIKAFSEVHNGNSIAESGYMFENRKDNKHAFKNHVVNDILEPGRTFATFAKACATIKRYTAQTKAALFACK
ncbi:9020_t:CDS:2, partial [Gigaspora rosea]